MTTRTTTLVLIIALATTGLRVSRATAGVVVLTNRAAGPVTFSVTSSLEKATTERLEPGDTLPLPVTGTVQLAFDVGGQRQHYWLTPDTIYFFAGTQEQLTFAQLTLPEMPPSGEQGRGADADHRPEVASPDGRRPSQPRSVIGIIPVKVLVDDEEPAVQRVWEQRLRDRLAKASEVFEQLFRIRFEVTATGTWDSDDAIQDFVRSLGEFERKVSPGPTALAIGFTSQYPADQFSNHLGGTRGPLYPHILIREWSPQTGETERLEILVHELGHFLGAAHSADDNSVMRPKMTDRRARARSYRMRFDPLNMLAMSLVAEEVRLRGIRDFAQFSPATQTRLRSIYAAMAKALPGDNAAPRYVAAFDKLAEIRSQSAASSPLVAAARKVLAAIVAAAREDAAPRNGDQRTEYLVRRAAAAARELPAEVAADAFLLGLGIGLDDSNVLRANPLVGQIGRQIESDNQRNERLAVLGTPTMQGRRDLAQHFAVSAALAVQLGPRTAETIGIFKEVRDSQGGTGFSFVDLSADLAGTTLAEHVRRGRPSLEELATTFIVDAFLPSPEGLQEGLTWKMFSDTYGSTQDERFLRNVAALRERILALPGYKASGQ